MDTTLANTYSQIYGTTTPVNPGWGFGAVTGGYEICIICPDSIHPLGKTAPPSRLIIGAGPDPDGNASVGVHSPSLGGFAQFTIDNVNPNSNITGVSISFGTEGTEIAATPGGGGVVGSAVPEPSGWFLAGGGLGLIWLGRLGRGKHKKS